MLTAAIAAVGALAASPAMAQSTTDAFNVPNVTVTAHTPVISGLANNNNDPAQDPIYNIFGGAITNTGGAAFEANDLIVFSDNINAASPAFVNFTIDPPGGGLGVAGVSLYVLADGRTEGGPRGVSSFSFFADVDGNGSYETTLVSGVNPIDDGLINTYLFPVTAALSFRAEFAPNGGPFPGPRVIELDAIIPEPASLGLLLIGGVALSLRRQTRRH